MLQIRYGAYAGGFNRRPIEVIKAVKELGFDLLEVSVGEKKPDNPKELRCRLEDAGLGVIAVHPLPARQGSHI